MRVSRGAVDGPAVELEVEPTTIDEAAEPKRSRRAWLSALAGVAAGGSTAAARGGPPRSFGAGGRWEVAADVDPGIVVSKLVRRLTMGQTPAELTLASQLGYKGYLDYQLNYTAIDDTAANLKLAPFTTLLMTPFQLFSESSAAIIDELTYAKFIRSVFSKRQLFERAVDFWTDHFNIDATKGDCAFLKTVDDAQVIRTHALGRFPALLEASARSPAMLVYLDNYVSTKFKPNENYARELLELHTMGVDGGYTQADVENIARCFTGWGMHTRAATPAQMGTFRFDSADHDNGEKIVLGNVIPVGGGINDGLTVLRILAEHPSTAMFIGRKIARWLLGEGVPERIVADVAATYTSTAGDIKAMIRTALKPSYLYAAPPRYKRPYHAYVSAVRALSQTFDGLWTFKQWLAAAGHVPFRWVTPDGYPDTLDYWGGLVLERWNFAASFGEGQISGLRWVLDDLFPDRSPEAVTAKLDTMVFGGEMPEGDRQVVLNYLRQSPRAIELIRDAVGLTLGCPSFQWY